MSCGPGTAHADRPLPVGWYRILADEGLRLFFPLAAIYAALWPLLWIIAFSLDLPLASKVPPSLWHAHEMLVGAFGAALIGFVTTAAPEWTDTEPLRGRSLWLLATVWGVGRVVGLFGWDGLGLVGAIADFGWIAFLVFYLIRLSIKRKTDRLVAFAFWLSVLAACVASARFAFWSGDIELATTAVHLIGFGFLGLLGIALARITVPVTNLALDPSESTSPFRPHPGRLNLAPGLVLVAMVGEALQLSEAVSAYLLIAAGAAFMDRVAEAFIGREATRTPILMLAGSSALAGLGLMAAGAARLGAPWAEVTGLHAAFMGGLGLGVYAVFSIAGLLHTNRPLIVPLMARVGAFLLLVAVAMRLAPDLGYAIPGPSHALASIVWAGVFALWLVSYGPFLVRFNAATEALAERISSESDPPIPLTKAPISLRKDIHPQQSGGGYVERAPVINQELG